MGARAAQERLLGRVATDGVGLALAGAGLAWGVLTSWLEDGEVVDAAGFFVVVGVVFVVSRLVSRVDLAIVPAAIVAIGVVVIAAGGPGEIYSDHPLDGPWGYSAVTGAFFLQCTIASTLLLVDRRGWVQVGGIAVLPFAFVPIATASWTAAAALLAVPLALLLRSVVGTRAAVASCAVLALVAVVTTSVLAATYSPGEREGIIDRAVDATLSERRLERQHDAWELMRDSPLTGVGAGGYADRSQSVARDADAPWAHHDYLQHGAEAGVPGMLLLLALVAWAFLRIRRSVAHRDRSAVVAVGLLGFAVHACTEQIVDRPAVAALTAALVAASLHPHRYAPSMVAR